MNARLFRLLLNLYPPFLGTGICVKKISEDFREILVEMRLGWYNRNYVNTHFGGSIYAMTDPFYMLMLIKNLGDEYIVWDKSATVDFVKPGRGTVFAHFILTEEMIIDIVERTKSGERYLPEFTVNVVDIDNDIVAVVKKVLYIRKKRAQGNPQ
jgi:hypothetical protein